ncbi:Asp-tRNA(Asn)/Glu-tRNA(Gln) amidotransferase subunit GatB [Candidatus Gottesmanbacteria bacterium]|nr:Asp-tRNA(Asn)/Glu-tRNA(Gln) amidotransferase subunit GatB [Candidatus Gottesmanbacteria bacterium]
MKYEPIIGLEVHVELATMSKMFCGCPADHFGKKPNTQTCPVCLGLPGALPVPNKKAVEWTVLLGLALHCSINEVSKFDRKHYFYPDLPKGYQISQYDMPLAKDGKLKLKAQSSKLKMEEKIVRIRRVHLEEDTGKLMHETVNGEQVTLIDFNRSGVPLVEIVTEPDFRTVEDVDIFLKKLQQIIRYLGISGADMEKGSMRLEPSISIQRQKELRSQPDLYKSGEELPAYRVELKNINSFRFVRKALEYEIERQTEMLARGEKPIQQTRGWNEGKGATVAQREKEEAHDYRYFPEPDIPPMRFAQIQSSKLKAQIPELPDEKKQRFMTAYGLNEYDADMITETREKAEFFEECVKVARALETGDKRQEITPKTIANWLINRNINIDEVLPAQLIERIIKATQVASVSDEELEKVIKQVLADNQKAVLDYKNGKEQALMFLVGQAMKASKGKVSAETLKQRLRAAV